MPTPPLPDPRATLALARETLAIESEAIAAMAQRLDERFVQALGWKT